MILEVQVLAAHELDVADVDRELAAQEGLHLRLQVALVAAKFGTISDPATPLRPAAARQLAEIL